MAVLINSDLLTPLYSEDGATEKLLEQMDPNWIEQLEYFAEEGMLERSLDKQGNLRFKLKRKGES